MHKAGFMDDNYRTVRSGLSFERFYSFPGPRFFPLRNGSCQACALILLFSRICKPPPSSRSTTDKYVQAQTRGLLGPRYLIVRSNREMRSFLFFNFKKLFSNFSFSHALLSRLKIAQVFVYAKSQRSRLFKM